MIYIKKKDRLYEYDITGSRVTFLCNLLHFFLAMLQIFILVAATGNKSH